jgi:hypothetical protein
MSRWPWALIEGVLEIESTYTEVPRNASELADGQEADYWLRLKIMTANADTMIRPYDVDPKHIKGEFLCLSVARGD